MRHVILTCKNHPKLRWSTKEIAWGPDGYNGSRSIFFSGEVVENEQGPVMYSDNSGSECKFSRECTCPVSDLVLAPEDAVVEAHRERNPFQS